MEGRESDGRRNEGGTKEDRNGKRGRERVAEGRAKGGKAGP